MQSKQPGVIFAATASLLLLPLKLFAQGAYPNPLSDTTIKTIPDLMIALVDLVFIVVMPIVVIFIIYAGLQFVTAGDNDAKLARAKLNITWALIGAAVLLGAKVLSNVVQKTILDLQ